MANTNIKYTYPPLNNTHIYEYAVYPYSYDIDNDGVTRWSPNFQCQSLGFIKDISLITMTQVDFKNQETYPVSLDDFYNDTQNLVIGDLELKILSIVNNWFSYNTSAIELYVEKSYVYCKDIHDGLASSGNNNEIVSLAINPFSHEFAVYLNNYGVLPSFNNYPYAYRIYDNSSNTVENTSNNSDPFLNDDYGVASVYYHKKWNKTYWNPSYIPTDILNQGYYSTFNENEMRNLVKTFRLETAKYFLLVKKDNIAISRVISSLRQYIYRVMSGNTKTYTNSTWSTSKTWYIKVKFNASTTSNVVNYVTMVRKRNRQLRLSGFVFYFCLYSYIISVRLRYFLLYKGVR